MSFVAPPGATPLTAEILAGLIPDHIFTQNELNEWEATNIAMAQRWAFAHSKNKKILTCDFATALHKRMFDQTWKWAGQFRKTQTNIGVTAYHTIQEK